MPISEYLKHLRMHVGHTCLMMPSVTAILYDAHDRILLVKHADAHQWVAPGGSLEPHERPADAVVREMWEETGLLVQPIRILGVFSGPEFLVTYQNGDQVSYCMTVFECQRVAGVIQPDGVETLEIGFFSADDLVHLNLPLWARTILPAMFRNQQSLPFHPSTWRPSVHGTDMTAPLITNDAPPNHT